MAFRAILDRIWTSGRLWFTSAKLLEHSAQDMCPYDSCLEKANERTSNLMFGFLTWPLYTSLKCYSLVVGQQSAVGGANKLLS